MIAAMSLPTPPVGPAESDREPARARDRQPPATNQTDPRDPAQGADPPGAHLGEANWERRRAELIGRSIPPGYRPLPHLIVPSALGFVGITASLLLLRELRLVELLAIPLTLLASLGFEWRVHKDVLHRRLPPFEGLYKRHELNHHVVFPESDMGIRSLSEIGLVLIPKGAIVGVFFMLLPLALIVQALASRNAAVLFVATGLLFFLVYEWMHLLYHLPEQSWLGRRGWVAALRTLHQRHHNAGRMKRWNFNVTLPVFDLLHGTLWSPAREAARDAAARRHKARRSAGRTAG